MAAVPQGSDNNTKRRQIHVALLVMGTLREVEGIPDTHKHYAQLYGRWFEKNQEVEVIITEYEVLLRRFPQSDERDRFDLFLFTGSRYGVYECALSHVAYDLHSEEWIADAIEFVRTLEKEKRRMLGICFGHQLIAHSLGGKVIKNPKGWECGWATFNLSPQGAAELNLATDEVLRPKHGEEISDSSEKTAKGNIDLYYSHQDAVMEIPQGFVSLGANELTPHQGMLKDRRIFTLQGHPEFDAIVLTALINRREKNNIFTKEDADVMRQSLSKPVDEVFVLDKMLRYLQFL